MRVYINFTLPEKDDFRKRKINEYAIDTFIISDMLTNLPQERRGTFSTDQN